MLCKHYNLYLDYHTLFFCVSIRVIQISRRIALSFVFVKKMKLKKNHANDLSFLSSCTRTFKGYKIEKRDGGRWQSWRIEGDGARGEKQPVRAPFTACVK